MESYVHFDQNQYHDQNQNYDQNQNNIKTETKLKLKEISLNQKEKNFTTQLFIFIQYVAIAEQNKARNLLANYKLQTPSSALVVFLLQTKLTLLTKSTYTNKYPMVILCFFTFSFA